MASIGQWVKLGDRSHPNLKLIDKILAPQATYSGHEEDLRKVEGFHFSGDKLHFDNTVHKIQESQRMSKGDRSHKRLKRLDKLKRKLTYDGWEEDFERAEMLHVSEQYGFDFETALEGMHRKQAIHVGNRTHANLRFLDSLKLSYPGWEKDVRSATWAHESGHSMKSAAYTITQKQRIFKGDRSHPRLVALDKLKLTYPGWESDVKTVEGKHTSWEYSVLDGLDANYCALLKRLETKQRELKTGKEDKSSLYPSQRKIVETHWTYPGHERDVKEAKESCYVASFKQDLERCRLRQMIHDGDFGHHPALIRLEKMRRVLSYPGHQNDIKQAQDLLARAFLFYMGDFDKMIEGMQNKQKTYNGLAGKLPGEKPDGRASKVLARLSFAVPMFAGRKKAQRSQDCQDHSEHQFGLCSICLDAPRTHVFVPCGHMCACRPCSQKLMKKAGKCPMCKQTATSVMEVFLP